MIVDKVKSWLRNANLDLTPQDESLMTSAIKEWLRMYKGQAEWLNSADGVYSCGIEQTLTRALRNKILAEADIQIDGESERAKVIEDAFLRMRRNLNPKLEMALAVGGFIIKPYMDDERIGVEFVLQGEYIPYGFDDDGHLIDVGFPSQIRKGDKVFTKIERHTLDGNEYFIETKAYNDKGLEIPLTNIEEWANITPQVRMLSSVCLFGVYKVPLANTIDLNSPLGISIYEPSKTLIMLADKQLSRLDWEYNGGQMAIDVDEVALRVKHNKVKFDECQQRLYRGIDLTDDKLYEVFAPSLRDANYRVGLNEYYKAIEDKTGVSRGTLSDVQEQAKTATEVISSKQREYITVYEHQNELERCLEQLYDAMLVYATMLGLTGDSKLIIDWGDSVLVDKQQELQEKINLMNNGVLSEAEVRSYYTGEDLETAQEFIASNQANIMGDLLNDE